jgi:hypothetical protein
LGTDKVIHVEHPTSPCRLRTSTPAYDLTDFASHAPHTSFDYSPLMFAALMISRLIEVPVEIP